MFTISRLEAIEDPGRASQIFPRSVSVPRPDGSTWTVGGNEMIQVCADCIDRSIASLVPRFARALMRRHGGSKEHAAVAFIETGLEWQDLNQSYIGEYRSAVFGDQVILAMGNPAPSWLRLSAEHTLSALYAKLATQRGVKPQAVAHSQHRVAAPRWFDKSRTEIRSVPSVYAWSINYVTDAEWNRKATAFIRADGDLSTENQPEKLAAWAREVGGPPAEPPTDHYPVSRKGLVSALTEEVKRLLY